MKVRGGFFRRVAVAALAWLLAVGGVVVAAERVAAQEDDSGLPEWVEDLASAEPNDPEPIPWEESPSAPPEETESHEPPPPPEFPEPATWEVALGAPGESGELSESSAEDLGVDSAEDLPVVVTPGIEAPSGGSLEVEILGHDVAEKLGASGFVFTVSETAGRDEPRVLAEAATDSVEGGLPTQLSLDYSGFATANGGDFAARLHVVALPDCVLAEPIPADCDRAGIPLPAQNDYDADKLVVDVADLAGLAAQAGHDASADPLDPAAAEPSAEVAASENQSLAVLAITSGPTSEASNYAASPMSSSSSWNVSPGSGEFTYSVPMAVPQPAGGSAPTVGLGYSSGAVDGLTSATNGQSSQVGLGWSDFANAFIERAYEPCIANNGPGGIPSTDLCWRDENATISLNGVSGRLIPVNGATEWRVENDPGWKIERHGGAAWSDIYGNQRWKVTAPDGTIYWFGYGHQPGAVTSSVLSVPVFSDHPNDPFDAADPACRQTTVRWCNQGWRWYLDRVEDPDGNLQQFGYTRETNHYTPLNGLDNGRWEYDRSAHLSWIAYGGRADTWEDHFWSARVTFQTQPRCAFLPGDCTGRVPKQGEGFMFPDLPTDLVCDSSPSNPCGVHAPSFFSSVRYTAVNTEVKVSNATSGSNEWERGWQPVKRYVLNHVFPWDAARDHKVVLHLQLASVQEFGRFDNGMGEGDPLPATTFAYFRYDNRGDHDLSAEKARRHHRLVGVTNPLGGQVEVTYDLPTGCEWPPPARWDQNPTNCFPQTVNDNGSRRTGVFYKYLVTKVVEKPEPGDASRNMTTSYTYEGAPAWAFDYGAFDRHDQAIGWSRWLGYGTTTITKGASKTRVRVFRGWNGDLMRDLDGCYCPIREEVVPSLTRPDQEEFVDDPAMAGRVLEEAQYGTIGGDADEIVQSTLYTYEQRTFDVPGTRLDPHWAGVDTVSERLAFMPGHYVTRTSDTSYEPLEPQGTRRGAAHRPVSTYETGWTNVSGDERCTLTTYAVNPAAWMLNYPASNTTVAGACDSGQQTARTETYYDESPTLGVVGARGNATRQRTLVDADLGSETSTKYDYLGRPTEVTDPNGHKTTTSYIPATHAMTDDLGRQVQVPWQTIVTNPLGHTTRTLFAEELGSPLATYDANERRTDIEYDPHGRTKAVVLPTEQGTTNKSWQFSYNTTTRSVWTRRLVAGTSSFEDSFVIADGFGRQRQTQAVSPASTAQAPKALVSETTYDDRGLVQDERVAQALNGTPGQYINGGGGHQWRNQTQHVYDELGREIEQRWWRDGTVAHSTTTSYFVGTVTVTGPDGVQAREHVDGLGRVTINEEWNGQNWVGSTTSYDMAARTVTVTDPEGVQVTTSYDQAGRQTSVQDPNRGNATFGYDLAGNPTSVTDSLGNSIHTVYDALGRPKDRHSGSPTGPTLASWAYDATGRKGLLTSSTSHTATGNWLTEVTGYDARNRPLGTKLTVPAGIPGLSGSTAKPYTTTQKYDLADRVTETTYPAIGDLAAETVTTTYDEFGLPTKLAGSDTYVARAAYDDRGRMNFQSLGPAQGTDGWMVRGFAFDADQRLAQASVSIHGTGGYQTVAKHEYGYRNDGNLNHRTTDLNGSQRRECYRYDARARLTEAYTVGFSAECATAQRGSGLLPYDHSYRYSPGGNQTQRIERAGTTTTTTNYTYPAVGNPRPNAPTKVGTDTYSWNSEGQLTSRTVGGQTETFEWDEAQGLLESVTGPSGQTKFTYDAGGRRLLRETPQGRTLYFAGQEVTANLSGSSVKAVRSYGFGGQLVATRTVSGVSYMVGDEAGSVEMAVPSGGSPNATRAYNPYGRVRSSTGTMPTNQGFLGQIEDSSTSLSYLNARYYDAKTGVFLSPDPVTTGNLKSLNPFSYGQGNPANLSDASGLSPSYTLGLEMQNWSLRYQNAILTAHIGYLNGKLLEAQGIINEQSRVINDLVTQIGALEAIIAEQATIIQKLQAQVAALKWIVYQQQRTISGLWSRMMTYAKMAYTLGAERNQILASPYYFRPPAIGMNSTTSWRERGVPPPPPPGPVMASSPQVTGVISPGLPPLPEKPVPTGDPVADQRAWRDYQIEYEGALGSDEYKSWLRSLNALATYSGPNSVSLFYNCDAVQVATHGIDTVDLFGGPLSDILTDPAEAALWGSEVVCTAQSIQNLAGVGD